MQLTGYSNISRRKLYGHGVRQVPQGSLNFSHYRLGRCPATTDQYQLVDALRELLLQDKADLIAFFERP
jgi:hypothetical protein